MQLTTDQTAYRLTIMEGATPTFMPDCDVVVIRGLVWDEA
jgi:hypothetical protein